VLLRKGVNPVSDQVINFGNTLEVCQEMYRVIQNLSTYEREMESLKLSMLISEYPKPTQHEGEFRLPSDPKHLQVHSLGVFSQLG
jgi:hypothetical protein